ncbi:MAG: RluA family pseudouridine synthase [Candidatus Omnitrophica bacterium]|nr:RluA family pseudouridine synthase [Candidatus Omnitrophota bacterium]MDE2008966.1 RluA family pseudouridine synthase [Candidatus Omnitrophota bacterium]MDE2230808.1 RluA family pseudouridine synthase [Candidatus Omnitrophota bacterium]
MKQTLTVAQEHEDLRLDVYLAQNLTDVPSRMFIKKLAEKGLVKVNGRLERIKYKVAAGDTVEVDMGQAAAPQDIPAEKMDLDVFYEDDDLAVINKPPGLSVHPAGSAQSGTLVNGLIWRYRELSDVNGADRPGIVHRLDRDTSGLILIAKTNMAHARLGRQFEKHTIIKRYVARVEGQVAFDQGVIDVPLQKHKKYHDHRQVAPEGEGKEAVTLYQVLKRFRSSTLLALYPQTGRTHQLRVHMKHLGHPILGDEKYGRRGSFGRLALHAQAIAFAHPGTKAYLEFSCPTPPEFLKDDL